MSTCVPHRNKDWAEKAAEQIYEISFGLIGGVIFMEKPEKDAKDRLAKIIREEYVKANPGIREITLNDPILVDFYRPICELLGIHPASTFKEACAAVAKALEAAKEKKQP